MLRETVVRVVMSKNVVVKMQLPIGGSAQRHALVYQRGRVDQRFILIDLDLRTRMAGRAKAFFHAVVHSSGVELGNEADWQDW